MAQARTAQNYLTERRAILSIFDAS